MADTKKCPACDVTIGTTEEKCPACGFEYDEETATNFGKYLTITEKKREAERKAKEVEAAKNNPPAPPKKRRFFDSLRSAK